jgi:hypothetical protein
MDSFDDLESFTFPESTMPFETSSLNSHPAESVPLDFEHTSYANGGAGYFCNIA